MHAIPPNVYCAYLVSDYNMNIHTRTGPMYEYSYNLANSRAELGPNRARVCQGLATSLLNSVVFAFPQSTLSAFSVCFVWRKLHVLTLCALFGENYIQFEQMIQEL